MNGTAPGFGGDRIGPCCPLPERPRYMPRDKGPRREGQVKGGVARQNTSKGRVQLTLFESQAKESTVRFHPNPNRTTLVFRRIAHIQKSRHFLEFSCIPHFYYLQLNSLGYKSVDPPNAVPGKSCCMLWRRPLPTFTASLYFTTTMSTDGTSQQPLAADGPTQELSIRTNGSSQENGSGAFE